MSGCVFLGVKMLPATAKGEPEALSRRQEGVKKDDDIQPDPSIRESLKALRLELRKSLSDFGAILAKAAGHKKAYTKQYVSRLEKGLDAITPEITKAFWRIAAAADETDPDIATMQGSTVYSSYNLDGVFVNGKSVECARPGCKVRFVKLNPFQKYHSPFCREQANKK